MSRRTTTVEESTPGQKRRASYLDATYGIFILVGIAATFFCVYQYPAVFKVWAVGLVYLMGLVAVVLIIRFLFKSSLHLTGWHEGGIILVFLVFGYFIMNEQNQAWFRSTLHTPFMLTPLGLVDTTVGKVALDLTTILIIFGLLAIAVIAYSARKLKFIEF